MPLPPEIEIAHSDDPYSSLAEVHYGTPTSIWGNFMSMLQNNVVKKMADTSIADPNIPVLQHFNFNHQTQDFINEYYARKAATPDEINEVKSSRPGFSAPEGVSKTVLDRMVSNWDDEQYYNFIANRPANAVAKWGGFLVGGTAGAFTDPIALAGGGIASGALGKVTAPFATRLMESLAVKETMGSAASQVATQLSLAGAHGGAGFAGFQLTEEMADEVKRASFNEPNDWIGAWLRTGHAAGMGTLFGGVAGALKIALVGYDRPVIGKALPVFEAEASSLSEAESIIAKHREESSNVYDGKYDIKKDQETGKFKVIVEPDKKSEVLDTERVGGLLNSEAFHDLPQKTKEVIGRYWKPWSKEADATAREDAMGQALNGATPDVSLVLRQGAMDEGARFREILRENGIDLSEMDERLLEADEEANRLIRELVETRDALAKTDKKLIKEQEVVIKGDKDLSQAGILDRLEKAQFNRDIFQSQEKLPDAITKRLDVEERIANLNMQLENDELSNTQRKKITKQLARAEKAKRNIKIETSREELTNIKRRLLDKGLPDNFNETRDYQRLTDLAKVWPQAKTLLDRVHLERDHQLQLRDLAGRKVIIDSMRKHINGTHEAVTQQEVKKYVDHIKGDLEPIEYDLPERVDTTYEAELNKFAEEEMKELIDNIDLPEFKAEIENTIKQREAIPTFKQMAKQLVNCILRNEV